MIKIGIRHNLLYPFLSIIFYFTREVISIILSSYLEFKSSLLLTLIMFISEIIAGSIFYFNNFYFLSKNEGKRTKSSGIILIHSPSKMSRLDKTFKLYFLIFIAAYFQFISFKITTMYLTKSENISKSLDIRLRSILPLLIGVLSLFTLRLSIVKHQIFSLTIISICLIITIISESIIECCYYLENIEEYLKHLLFVFIRAIIDAFVELSEKYLLEYNFINPFYIVMFEGFFGSIFISINSIETNPFKEIKEYKKEDYKVLLIICLIIYFFLSGGRNIYRISTNKIYSPMARSLTDAFLDPILIFYYYYSDVEKHKNIFYFIANLILSIIVVFCVGVYNDFFVLYCCGLEHHTHYEISRRASKKENIPLLQLEKNFEDDGEGIN